jgi:hypothetical protein
LPTILSQEEVAQLIDAAPTPFYRTILITLDATGVRNATARSPLKQKRRVTPGVGGAHVCGSLRRCNMVFSPC